MPFTEDVWNKVSIDALFSEMSGLALSQGSLLNVFQGKRSYQPVWQVGIPHSFFEVRLGLILPSGDLYLHAAWTEPVRQLLQW